MNHKISNEMIGLKKEVSISDANLCRDNTMNNAI